MASPSQFFDPFFRHDHRSNALLKAPQEGNGNAAFRAPLGPTSDKTLPVTGQGTIAVRSAAINLLKISVSTSPELLDGPILHLDIGPSNFLFYFENKAGKHEIPFNVLKGQDACYLNSGLETTYWLSLDKENGILRYGKYFTNKSMTLVEATLKQENKDGVMIWKNEEQFSWLEKVKTTEVMQDDGQDEPGTTLLPLPVVIDLSPFVLSSDRITLRELESGQYTVPVNLPDACQTLYGNVAGMSIMLDDDDFPDFTRAIEWSCSNPEGWAYKKLIEKAGEFGKSNPDMTYLRITLGYNQGDSPGVPYVLEIWPSGHYSPVHDHGRACAVIKVLFGEIEATYYDSLDKPKLIGQALLKEGYITWLSPENYQIHMLHNESPGVCCTIQCYRYEDTDHVHYDGFDYAGDDGQKHKFTPNSDMAFTDFRRKMLDEWNSRRKP